MSTAGKRTNSARQRWAAGAVFAIAFLGPIALLVLASRLNLDMDWVVPVVAVLTAGFLIAVAFMGVAREKGRR